MSWGVCSKCGEYTDECICTYRCKECGSVLNCVCPSKDMPTPLCQTHQNAPKPRFSNLNASTIPLGDGEEPPATEIPTKWINVKGREEHEAIIKSAERCKELGLCQYYEIMIYLARWKGWLGD